MTEWGGPSGLKGKYPAEVRPLYAVPPSPPRDEVVEALTWALAEIDGRTKYDNDGQRTAAIERARRAISSIETKP
jgi:hypothetical protein